jgi:hypothetical protein
MCWGSCSIHLLLNWLSATWGSGFSPRNIDYSGVKRHFSIGEAKQAVSEREKSVVSDFLRVMFWTLVIRSSEKSQPGSYANADGVAIARSHQKARDKSGCLVRMMAFAHPSDLLLPSWRAHDNWFLMDRLKVFCDEIRKAGVTEKRAFDYGMHISMFEVLAVLEMRLRTFGKSD